MSHFICIAFTALMISVAALCSSPPLATCNPKNEAAASALKNVHRYIDQGQAKEAIAEIERAIKLDPNCTEAYTLRAVIRGNLNDFKNSDLDFQKALSLDPKSSDIYASRGELYLVRSMYKEAEKDLSKAIMLDPTTLDNYRMRSMAYRELGLHDLAIKDLTREINSRKDNAHIYLARAGEYAAKKDYNQALTDLDTAIKGNDPKYTALAVMTQARLYCQLGKHDKALKNIDSIASKSPQDYEFQIFKGTEEGHLKRYDAALKSLGRAISLAPDFAEAYRQRAAIYKAIGKADLAKKDLAEAAKL